jgi:hypothetical protein
VPETRAQIRNFQPDQPLTRGRLGGVVCMARKNFAGCAPLHCGSRASGRK